MTDADFRNWLANSDAAWCLLVEAGANSGGVEVTRYMSDKGYVTSGTDNPAHKNYQSVIVGGCTVSEQLGVDGQGTLTVGDVEIANVNGELDSWLNDVWQNRVLNMYIGDVRWPRADFRQVFSGVIKDIKSRTLGVLNIEFRDKLQRLNTPISDTLLGGTSSAKDRLIPLTFGECHNVEPLLIDEALLKYKFSQFSSERIIEVRDGGVVVSHTPSLVDSTFILLLQPFQQVTASVQGDTVGGYSLSAAQIIQRLVTGFGTQPFTTADIDTANFAAFASANPQAMGVYANSRENNFDICQRLAASVGAQLTVSALDKLKLVKVELPAPGSPTIVREKSIRLRSFELVERLAVKSSVKLGYNPNWTVQPNLLAGIPTEHAALYAQEWLTVTASDSNVASMYRMQDEPVQENTLLLSNAHAMAEATRRLNFRKVPRTIYRYDGFRELILDEIGGAQFIIHKRFGFQSGKNAQVIKTDKNWLKGEVSFEVVV